MILQTLLVQEFLTLQTLPMNRMKYVIILTWVIWKKRLLKNAPLDDIRIFTETVYKHVALIVGRVYSKPNMQRKSAEETLDIVSGFFNSSFMMYMLQTSKKQEEIDVRCRIINNAFQTFSSEYLARKYFEERKCFIKPKSIPVNVSLGFQPRNGKTTPVTIHQDIQLIPVDEVCKQFFDLPGV